MNFIKKVFSDLHKKCKHSRIESNSNATQNNDIFEIQSSQLSEDKDFEDYHHKCDNDFEDYHHKCDNFDDLATDKNITNENDSKENVKFINKLIPHKTVDNNSCSNFNYAENKTDSKEICESNSLDKELILDSINSNLSPKIIDEDKELSEIVNDKLDNDNIILAEDCIASDINLDKISFTYINCIDKTKDKNESNTKLKTEIEFTDSTHNIDGDNESVTSDSILVGIDLDEEYYSDLKINPEDSKPADNSKTELENTCIEINISESSNDPSKVNKEPSYLFEPDNIDNDYKNVCNSEMLVSLEEFDRILQRYSNDKEKDSHCPNVNLFPNDCKNCNKSIIDPLSIDEIENFISNLNETQPNTIIKPKGVIEIDISGEVDNYYEQFSQPIKSQSNLFNESLKDDVISISSEECSSICIELKKTERNNNDIDTISIKSSDSDCSGYHSSDFEFISEREAKLDGFIINFVPSKVDKPVPRFGRPNIIRSSNKELPSNNQDNICKVVTINEDYRQVHEIPEGDNYLNLFQGIYNPVLPNSAIYFLENKSVRATGMHVEFEGLGFDRQMAERRRYDDSDDEFKEEAQESLKKILSMYPRENRKRRRRF